MRHTELINRLRDVIDVAIADSDSVASEFSTSWADHEDSERHQREALAVRDEVIAALAQADKERTLLLTAIKEALAFEAALPAIATVPKRILKDAVKAVTGKEGAA